MNTIKQLWYKLFGSYRVVYMNEVYYVQQHISQYGWSNEVHYPKLEDAKAYIVLARDNKGVAEGSIQYYG